MWSCRFPTYPKCALLFIGVVSKAGIGALRIWNFNKSSIDATKGVKELEIFLNDSPKWFGTVKCGVGNDTSEYGTTIFLHVNDILLPELSGPQLSKKGIIQDLELIKSL